MGEVRIVLLDEQLVVAGEEVEDLDRAGEVPLARRRLEGETATRKHVAEFGDGAGRLLGQADAQPFHRAIDPWAILAAAILGAHFLFVVIIIDGIAGSGRLGRRFRLVEVFVYFLEIIAGPFQRGFGRISHPEDREAFADGKQLA